MSVEEHAFSGEIGHLADRKQFVLTEAEQREIAQLAQPINIRSKATVFKEREPKVAVYTLTQGIAIRYRMKPDGHKQIVDFALPGDFLNSPFPDRHTCSVDVISQATAYQFPKRRFMTFVEAHPKILRELLETYLLQIDAAYEHMLLLGRGTAEERFVEFIIRWRERVGRKGALANLVPLPMSRRNIADYLGLTIETVSRLLANFEREKVLRVIPKGLQLMGPTERPLLFERSYKVVQ